MHTPNKLQTSGLRRIATR